MEKTPVAIFKFRWATLYRACIYQQVYRDALELALPKVDFPEGSVETDTVKRLVDDDLFYSKTGAVIFVAGMG